MSASIKVEVAGCTVVPVVDGVVFSAWPFNDNNAHSVEEWKQTCLDAMSRAAVDLVVPLELAPEWEDVATEFYATSQASEWRS